MFCPVEEVVINIEWLPYCGAAPAPLGLMERWNVDPILIAVMIAVAIVAHRYPAHFARRPAASVLGVSAFLFISPFCALGSALFTVRIIHDVILVAVLSPLIVATLRLHRRAVPGGLAAWTAAHALVFWFWHAPPAYDAAMSSDLAFWLMQASLVGTAAVWWAKVFRATVTASTIALLATMVAMGVLGALLAFAPRAFYAPHWLTVQAWGLSPLEDQQIAGIVMWAPASLVYLLAALAILYHALGRRAAA